MSGSGGQSERGPMMVLIAFLSVGAGLYFVSQFVRALHDDRTTVATVSLAALVLIGATLFALRGGAGSPGSEQTTHRGTKDGSESG